MFVFVIVTIEPRIMRIMWKTLWKCGKLKSLWKTMWKTFFNLIKTITDAIIRILCKPMEGLVVDNRKIIWTEGVCSTNINQPCKQHYI